MAAQLVIHAVCDIAGSKPAGTGNKMDGLGEVDPMHLAQEPVQIPDEQLVQHADDESEEEMIAHIPQESYIVAKEKNDSEQDPFAGF